MGVSYPSLHWDSLSRLRFEPGHNATVKRRPGGFDPIPCLRSYFFISDSCFDSFLSLTQINNPVCDCQSRADRTQNGINCSDSWWSDSLLAGALALFANGFRPADSRLTLT